MRKKGSSWKAPAQALAAMPDISGNTVNGLGEGNSRPASPFFWHEPEYQQFGEMQNYTLGIMFGLDDGKDIIDAFNLDENFQVKPRGPAPIELSEKKIERQPALWSQLVKDFALSHHADVVGIAKMQPEWVIDGFEIKEEYVVIVGVAHDFDEMSQAPSIPGNNRAIVEVGKQYTRAAVAAAELNNYIRGQGYESTCHPGPKAHSLLMIPAAIEAGLGELGKHGSLINRELGSSFRLSAVTTNMPLTVDEKDIFGIEDFCTRCQVCTRACPPDAIYSEKQLVRGVEKWYVDFDKCIPYFAETRGCGICIVVCPWSLPGVADNLLVKMARKKDKETATG